MTDIVEFIRARLDEDERIARAAGAGPWRYRDHPADRALVVDAAGEVVVYDEGWPSEDQGRHMARHDPARVLREVAAKWAILAETLAYEAKIDGEWGCCHRAEQIAAGQCATKPADVATLRWLASTWSDHADYDQAWAVQ